MEKVKIYIDACENYPAYFFSIEPEFSYSVVEISVGKLKKYQKIMKEQWKLQKELEILFENSKTIIGYDEKNNGGYIEKNI